jgi:hypothetical protein
MKIPLKIVFLLALIILFSALNSGLGAQEYKIFKNAKIITLGKAGTIDKGMILVKNGKIEKVGTSFDIPAGAQVVDLSTRTIVPGFVCAASSLFLPEKDRAYAEDESPDTNILEGLDPFDPAVPEVLKNGVTTAYISSVSFRTVGGLGAVVKLVGKEGKPFEVVKEKADLKLNIERLLDKATSSLLRLTQYQRLRALFLQAEDYKKEWVEYDQKLQEYREAVGNMVKTAEKKRREPERPKRDEGKEILLQAMDKRFPVRIVVHHPDSLANALRLAGEFGLKLILEKAEEWPSVQSLLQEGSFPLLTNPWLNYRRYMVPGGASGYMADQLKAGGSNFFYSDVDLAREGVPGERERAFSSLKLPLAIIPSDDFPLSARYLRYYAGLLIAEGFSAEDALKGDPLNSLSKIKKVFMNGQIVWEIQ